MSREAKFGEKDHLNPFENEYMSYVSQKTISQLYIKLINGTKSLSTLKLHKKSSSFRKYRWSRKAREKIQTQRDSHFLFIT